MTNVTRVAIVSLAFLFAIPGLAEADRREKRRPHRGAELAVTKWWPQSGPVGTTVTITGRGFSKRTQLVVGGTIIRPRRITARRITFVVPTEYGDGSIALRRGGGGDYDEGDNELDVGTYDVIVPDLPEISSWAPKFGGPGTLVRIEGRHFDGADVYWGNKRLRAARTGKGWIEVNVPNRARRGELFSVRSKYGKAVTRKAFELYEAARIDRIDPWRAKWGQTIVIHGRNFGKSPEVFWGDTQLSVSKIDRRGRKLWVQIPDDLGTGNRWLHVHDGRGKIRSPKKLEIYESERGRHDDGDDNNGDDSYDSDED